MCIRFAIHSFVSEGIETKNQINFARILFGITQGSILWPVLFHNYICGIFLETNDTEIANSVDDNTQYICLPDFDSVISKSICKSICKHPEIIFRWFYNNNLIPNAGKSHLIVSCKENLVISNLSCFIDSEVNVKLLVICISNNINFEYHFNQPCKKASKKLDVSARIVSYMDVMNLRMLLKAFVSPQSSHFPLILIFHS